MPQSVVVFPTPVGMFRFHKARPPVPPSFPHARGDVPEAYAKAGDAQKFSPRPWGCSFIGIHFAVRYQVFPTPVGMFRTG